MDMNEQMNMGDFLKRGMNGGNLLFCGAGFSADCLNFSKNSLGTLSPLLKELNDILGYDYDDIQKSTDAYLEKYTDSCLLRLLKEKYTVLRRPTTVDTILKYPWSRIYTTNYDDVISKSLDHLGKKHFVANNIDDPLEFEKINGKNDRWVVHLHGAIRYWNRTDDFKKSCVLGRKSYMDISLNSKWESTFRHDYAKAKGVFFVGFSNSDFYFAKQLHSIAASEYKVFFINSEDSINDFNLEANQKDYGKIYPIGKDGFVDIINLALESNELPPPSFDNFEQCKFVNPSDERASVDQQKQFLISGVQDSSLIHRDILDGSHSYRAKRESTAKVIKFLKDDNSIALVLGGICSGKTTILDECVIRLVNDGNDVFRYKAGFDNLLEEVENISVQVSSSVVVIDDCFSLRDSLIEIIKILNQSRHRLLLASRTRVYDSGEDLRSIISEETSFKTFYTDNLNQEEGEKLIDCADRLSVWGENVISFKQKKEILEDTNHSYLASFLLHVFKSEFVKGTFKKEIEKMKAVSWDVEKALIIALYLRSINSEVEERVLSLLIRGDGIKSLKKISPSPFISYNPWKREFDIMPSVNAREALWSLFDPKTVTSAIIEAVEALEHDRHVLPFKHVFTQMMRYTQLKQVVDNVDQRNRFFDRLSELKFCRDHILFWLQWSMAMKDQKRWDEAFKYLKVAYKQAGTVQNFDTLQLDNQKVKLLLDSIPEKCSFREALQNFREASTLLIKSISGSGGETFHNYRTIMESLENFFQKANPVLLKEQKILFIPSLVHLKKIVERKSNKFEAHPRNFTKKSMGGAIVSIDTVLGMLQPTEKTKT